MARGPGLLGGNKEVELTQTDLRVSTLTCARLTVPCVYQLVGNLDTLHSGDDDGL